jgi:hypothetical protein
VVQNFWNWFGEGVKGWRCGLEKVYNTVNGAQWVILVRTQKAKLLIGKQT